MDIRKYIKELLFEHDCVIIPGFGGFVTSYQSSEIQRFKNVIYPPSKSILFNRKLQTNDGVLINQVAQREKIDYRAAEEKVRKWAVEWNNLIDNRGMLLFPDIGKLYINSSNALVFLPELRKNYLMDTFGLKPIAYHLHTESSSSPKILQMERKTQPVEEPEYDENQGSGKKGLRIALFAAAAVILILLIPQLFLQNMLPENLRIHQLNVMPLFGDSSAVEKKTPAEKKETISPGGTASDAATAPESSETTSETAEVEEPAAPEPAASLDPSLPASGNFYIVFGESDFISDAVRLKKKLDTEHAKTFEVFSDDGNYVVGLPAGDSQAQAQASLDHFRGSSDNLKVIVRE